MRGDSAAVVVELSCDQLFPTLIEAPAGDTQLPPLLRALLRVLAQRWAGDVLVRDARQQLMAALHCESGYVVSARVNGFDALFDGLTGVCERVISARVSLVP